MAKETKSEKETRPEASAPAHRAEEQTDAGPTSEVVGEVKEGTFSKSYRLQKNAYNDDPEYWQERQINDVRQSAMQQGFRPTGDPKLADTEEDERSVYLRFTVSVETAQGADSDQAYEVTHAKVSPLDQKVFAKAVKADEDPDRAAGKTSVKDRAEPSTATQAEQSD